MFDRFSDIYVGQKTKDQQRIEHHDAGKPKASCMFHTRDCTPAVVWCQTPDVYFWGNRHTAIRARILLVYAYRMQVIKGQHVMPKERKSNKEAKKKALLTPKEKKAAKLAKKENKPFTLD